MRASNGTGLRTKLFSSNLLRILGIGALSLHLAAAEDDCTIRILVGQGEGEGEGEGELDSDGDGLLDVDERAIGTDPFNPDTDGDGLLDGDELFCDGPVMAGGAEEDAPRMAPEPLGCCTDPLNPDSDFDGIPDGEDQCSDPYVDSDFDGLSDADEAWMGTDPFNPDTDGDGLLDGQEAWCYGVDYAEGDRPAGGADVAYPVCCTDPLNADSDFDGIPDGQDSCEDPWLDSDGDGIADVDEAWLGTDPLNPDTDGDGLLDGAEAYCYGVALPGEGDGGAAPDQPTEPTDPTEPMPPPPPEGCCTDPLNADSDFDGIPDGQDTCEIIVCDPATGETCEEPPPPPCRDDGTDCG